MVERLLVWQKWGEDRGVVAKECEQYAERLVGYVRKRLLILIGEWLCDVRRTMCTAVVVRIVCRPSTARTTAVVQ